MPADIRTQPFSHAIRDLANLRGLQPSAFGLTGARMLAAARLWPVEKDGVPGFLDENRELTKADWHALLQLLAKQWRPGGGRSDNPFERPAEPSFDEPGALERLRRLVLSYLDQDGSKISVPTWLLPSVVELARPHTLFSGGLAHEVQELVTKTIGATPRKRIFCAYDNAIEIALQLAADGADVTLDIEAQEMAALCSCLAIGAGLRLHVRRGDPLALAATDMNESLLVPNTFDASFVAPPLNVRLPMKDAETLGTNLPSPPSSEAAGVMLALARSRDLAVCLVAPSFLFQTSKVEQAFKERAVSEHGLDTVVSLPRGTFGNTSIAAALIVFKRESGSHRKTTRTRDVFMIDARGERDGLGPFPGGSDLLAKVIHSRKPSTLSATVAVEELASNDFNLSVERYVLSPAARRMRELAATTTTVQLDDLVEFQRPQALPGTKNAAVTETAFEVGVSDLDEAGLVRPPAKQVAITTEAALQVRRARLEPGDIVLVIKGSIGKIGFVRDIPEGATWLASQSFVILRLRRSTMISDPRVVFRFLSSNLGQTTMQSLRVGSTVPGLQMADVRRLTIVIPDLKEQATIAEEVQALFALQDEITRLRSELVERQSKIWPDTQVAGPPSIRAAAKSKKAPAVS